MEDEGFCYCEILRVAFYIIFILLLWLNEENTRTNVFVVNLKIIKTSTSRKDFLICHGILAHIVAGIHSQEHPTL